MAEFPISRTDAVPSGQAPAVRANLDVSTGEAGVWSGMGELGQAIFAIGQKRKEKDNRIALSNAVSALDAYENKQLLDLRDVQFATVDEIDGLEAKYPESYERQVQDLAKNLSPDTAADFKVYVDRNKPVGALRFNNALYKRKEDLHGRNLGLNFQALLGSEPIVPLDDTEGAVKENYRLRHGQWQAKYNAMKINYGKVLGPETIETQEVYALINLGRYDDAEIAVKTAKSLLPQDVAVLTNRIEGERAAVQRQQAELLRQKQEETSRGLLADLFEGKLTDLNVITSALRQGFLSDTDARYFRSAMLNPEPAETALPAYVKVKEALQDLALGTKTKQDVLSLITSMTDSLSPADVKSFTNDVYAEPDKENSFWEKEAYQTIEKRLMTLDPLTGRLFGSTAQIDATDLAKIRFDEAIKSAAKAGKPLKGTDFLKKAVEISNALMPKQKMIISGGQKLPASEFEEFHIEGEIPPVPAPVAGARKPIPEESKRAAERLRQRIKDLKAQPAKETKSPYPDYPDAFYEAGEWRVIRNGKKYRIKP